jgi:flagellar motility protein MotE (MotC chaperone)
MRLFNPRQILPLLIFFGVLTIGVRIDAVWEAASSGKLSFTGPARAQTKTDAPPAVSAPAPADAKSADTKPAADANPAPSGPAPDANAADEASPAEAEVLKQLADRRDELEKRRHDLDMREDLLKVAEQRVDQKIKEMQSIRLQLQTMVDQINGAQQTQLDNLVKIYETMKPADAAKIFENLDMPVLLGVIQRMKPKSTAPIMAAMAPQKAKEVTVALTKQDQLPPVK